MQKKKKMQIFFFTAYAFFADVRVYADERATGFRRPEPPDQEPPRSRSEGCRGDELDEVDFGDGHGHPSLHDPRSQLDHAAHLRLRRQSVVLGTSVTFTHSRAYKPPPCLGFPFFFLLFCCRRVAFFPCLSGKQCRAHQNSPSSPHFFIHCPRLCSTDAISVLLVTYLYFYFVSVESVRGIDPSRTHGAQSNQLMFQRVVVRIWLECTARRRCRHGICRIILVFAPTDARATTTNNHSGKAGEEKLMFFQYATLCCVFISNDIT